MANFAASALVAGQTLFTEQATNTAEFRLPDVAAIRTARISGLHNPSIESVKASVQRAVNAYFPIRQAATNGTTRPALHTGARGDSDAVAYTWTTFSEPFSISLNQAQNNVMTFAQMYAAAKRNAILNVLNRADAWFLAALLAEKTAINVGGANGTFNATDDVFEIDGASKDFFFSEAKIMMEQNLYRSNLVAIVDAKGKELARRVGAQGTGNSVNLSYTIDGYSGIMGTTRQILDPTEFDASGIFFDPTAVAIAPWVQPDYRKDVDPDKAMNSAQGDRGQFSLAEMPGVSFMEKYYVVQADASAAQGTTDDVLMQGLISLDLAFAVAPTSDFRGSDDSVVYVAGALKV
jgi:hypothetical protein